MIRILCYISILTLIACSDVSEEVLIGENLYDIPSQYFVVTPTYIDTTALDNSVELVSITFGEDEAFKKYIKGNAWLPKSPITLLMLSPAGSDLTGLDPSFTPPVTFSTEKKEVIEFENSYRLFSNGYRSKWQAIPKKHTVLDNNLGKSEWIVECISLGGMKGSNQSHNLIDIPTSCKLNIRYQGIIIRLTTSESNFFKNIDNILRLIFEKLDSWRMN